MAVCQHLLSETLLEHRGGSWRAVQISPCAPGIAAVSPLLQHPCPELRLFWMCLPSVPALGQDSHGVSSAVCPVARCVSVGSPAEICGQKLLGQIRDREGEFSAEGVGWVGL